MDRRVVIALVAALALAGAGLGGTVLFRGPPAVPQGTFVASAHGVFRASYETSPREIPINTLHTWTVHLTDADGRPVPDAAITIRGDMPGHGHGLPTAPQARALGGEDYALEGMQFQMTGDWYVELEIQAGGRSDTLRIDFTIS
jgi:hypothetical protein